jgi:hypothetical protein
VHGREKALGWRGATMGEGGACKAAGSQNRGGGCGLALELDHSDLTTTFAEPPTTATEHFFVDKDFADPTLDDKIASLENDVQQPKSITHFLTLPTVTKKQSMQQGSNCGFHKISDFDK